MLRGSIQLAKIFLCAYLRKAALSALFKPERQLAVASVCAKLPIIVGVDAAWKGGLPSGLEFRLERMVRQPSRHLAESRC